MQSVLSSIKIPCIVYLKNIILPPINVLSSIVTSAIVKKIKIEFLTCGCVVSTLWEA